MILLKLETYFAFAIAVVLISCAQVVSPTGGEKDVTPPKVLSLTPENEQTNFKAAEIKISFDEFVKFVRLKEELIVSPPLKYDLQTKIKGKEITIAIKDTLKENTTYVLNFGNSICDIRENNPLPNFSYVFSTGSEIDTLSVSGRIIQAYNSKVEKGVLVMLYDADEDSLPLKELPTYIARTDENGLYKIGNVKAGKYKTFALKDENKNYLFDRKTENIAFDTSMLVVNDNIEKLNFYLFQENHEKQFVKSQKEQTSNVTLNFNLPFDSIQIRGLDTNIEEVLKVKEIGVNKDSVSLWFNEMDNQRMKLIVHDYKTLNDTITVKVDSANKKLKIEMPATHNFFRKLEFTTNTPINEIDISKIKILQKDSTAIEFSYGFKHNRNQLYLAFNHQQDSNYAISFLPGAFIDFYGKTNDSLKKKVKFNAEKEFGNLTINIHSSIQDDKLLQLLNHKGDVIKMVNIGAESVLFKHLNPGNYRLRCIVDRNKNGAWDTGNYILRQLPEKTILLEEEINVRANWDKEIKWEIEYKE